MDDTVSVHQNGLSGVQVDVPPAVGTEEKGGNTKNDVEITDEDYMTEESFRLPSELNDTSESATSATHNDKIYASASFRISFW